MKKSVLIALLLFLSPAWAQVSPDRLLVLVVGPSGDRISPVEAGVIEELNKARSELGLYDLRMGSMHFDRPNEAQFLQQVLQIRPSDGVTLALVQLDSSGQPQRKLHAIPGVTQARMVAARGELVKQWQTATGRLATAVPLPPNPTGPGPVPPTRPIQPTRKPTQVYSREGIVIVARTLENQTGELWGIIQHSPLRSDGEDREVREALAEMHRSATSLRVALEEGSNNPVQQYQSIFRARKAWEASEPHYFLPVEHRKKVGPLDQILDMVEETYTQLNP